MDKKYWIPIGVSVLLIVLFVLTVTVFSCGGCNDNPQATDFGAFTTKEECTANDLFWDDADMACVLEIRLEAELLEDGGDGIVGHLREHPTYEKFKSLYPNSTETILLSNAPKLFVDQRDDRGNVLQLLVSKGHDAQHYEYLVSCYSGTPSAWQYVPHETAHDFLGKNDCLLD